MPDSEKKCSVCTDLEATVSAIMDAFPRNDLGKPDYDAHRKSHIADDKEKDHETERMNDIKDNAIKQIVSWGLKFILLALAAYFGLKS